MEMASKPNDLTAWQVQQSEPLVPVDLSKKVIAHQRHQVCHKQREGFHPKKECIMPLLDYDESKYDQLRNEPRIH